MPYTDRFQMVDGLTPHLDTIMQPSLDPIISMKYTGFFCVSAVTVIELAVKDIIIDFAEQKHAVFGAYCQNFFDKMNGRVTIKDIRELHLKKFGAHYVDRFTRVLDRLEGRELRHSKRSIKASYGSLITWRHAYAHLGVLPENASYREAKQGFELGKKLLACLHSAMRF